MLISPLPSKAGPQYPLFQVQSPFSPSTYSTGYSVSQISFSTQSSLSLQLILPVQPTHFFLSISVSESHNLLPLSQIIHNSLYIFFFLEVIEVYRSLSAWFMVWAAFIVTQSQAVSDVFTWEAVTHPAVLWCLGVARPPSAPSEKERG